MILLLYNIKLLITILLFLIVVLMFRTFRNEGNSGLQHSSWMKMGMAPVIIFGAILLYQVRIACYERSSIFKKVIQKEDRRYWDRDRFFERGRILDRNGNVLAENDLDSEILRHYPHAEETVHILGYFMPERRERTGFERIFNESLKGGPASFISVSHAALTQRDIRIGYSRGKDLSLTIDLDLQKEAFRGLAGRKGAAVGIDPATGEVLFLVSSPGFDPEGMYAKDNWKEIVERESQLNRAVNGLYEPGSIFKVIIAAAALENGEGDFMIDCSEHGFTPEGAGRPVTDHGNEYHGNIGLSNAVMKSCNVYFAQLGIHLSERVVMEYAEKFMFNKEIKFKSSHKMPGPVRSFFPDLGQIDANSLAWSSIGQFKLQTTPFHMAIVASVIANNGVMVDPRFEKGIGVGKSRRLIGRETSVRLRKMMFEVVGDPERDLYGPSTWEDRERFGTGWKAKVKSLPVAGKTGTAENPHGEPHAWFIGFAPVEKPVIAFAFIVENGGYGGEVSAPIARMVLSKAVEKGYFR